MCAHYICSLQLSSKTNWLKTYGYRLVRLTIDSWQPSTKDITHTYTVLYNLYDITHTHTHHNFYVHNIHIRALKANTTTCKKRPKTFQSSTHYLHPTLARGTLSLSGHYRLDGQSVSCEYLTWREKTSRTSCETNFNASHIQVLYT